MFYFVLRSELLLTGIFHQLLSRTDEQQFYFLRSRTQPQQRRSVMQNLHGSTETPWPFHISRIRFWLSSGSGPGLRRNRRRCRVSSRILKLVDFFYSLCQKKKKGFFPSVHTKRETSQSGHGECMAVICVVLHADPQRTWKKNKLHTKKCQANRTRWPGSPLMPALAWLRGLEIKQHGNL